MQHRSADDFYVTLAKHLAEPGYSKIYMNEAAFEADVWDRVITFMSEVKGASCLTSHTTNRKGRSGEDWKAFCREERGPDVKVLGSNSRLDIVIKHPVEGSIGIEVKCLGNSRHADKLTQGIGQTMLALAHRDRTLLMIHCGTVETNERNRLRTVVDEICQRTRMSIVVVP